MASELDMLQRKSESLQILLELLGALREFGQKVLDWDMDPGEEFTERTRVMLALGLSARVLIQDKELHTEAIGAILEKMREHQVWIGRRLETLDPR